MRVSLQLYQINILQICLFERKNRCNLKLTLCQFPYCKRVLTRCPYYRKSLVSFFALYLLTTSRKTEKESVHHGNDLRVFGQSMSLRTTAKGVRVFALPMSRNGVYMSDEPMSSPAVCVPFWCPYYLRNGFAVSLWCVFGCAWLLAHQRKTAQPTLRLGGSETNE